MSNLKIKINIKTIRSAHYFFQTFKLIGIAKCCKYYLFLIRTELISQNNKTLLNLICQNQFKKMLNKIFR